VLPVDRDGVLDLDALEDTLRADEGPVLVSVMLANNETGVIQPVAEAAALAHRHGALIHCDAAQGFGRIPVSFATLGVDLLTLSAHKVGGAPGTGVLVVGDGVALTALMSGGGQESGLRAGTENVAGIAGFGAAAIAAEAERAAGGGARLAALRDALEAGVRRTAPEAVFLGRKVARLPNTSCIALPGRPAELQVIALDLAGVAVSAGSACSSGKVRRSHVLGAMGHGDAIAGCAIRVSLGWNSEPADVGRILDAWAAMRVRAAERADLVPA
jgi:cysteine desulfurase